MFIYIYIHLYVYICTYIYVYIFFGKQAIGASHLLAGDAIYFCISPFVIQ